MSEPASTIINITDEQVIAAIKSAQRRVVVVAPGLSQYVATTLAEKWCMLGAAAVNVVLDANPEVCRLGYGELKAVQLLQEAASKLGASMGHQTGIRICLVVADDTTLIYSPTPLVVEAKSHRPTQPNGICLTSVPPELTKEIDLENEGNTGSVIGTKEISSEDVVSLVADLAENPPRKFDLTQRVQVFNAAFEFVEFRLEGCSIARKTVPLPSDLVVAAKDPRTQKKVSSSFHLIERDNKRLSGEGAMKLKETIAQKFLVNLPGYGNVMLRINKASFGKAVKRLELYVRAFQSRVERELQKAIDANRNALVEALLPVLINNPPLRSIRFIGRNPDREALRNWLNTELETVFGNAKSHMSKMEVSVIYKDVTYDSLNDPKFIETARKQLPTLKKLYEEFDTAKTISETPVQENLFQGSFFDESSKAVN